MSPVALLHLLQLLSNTWHLWFLSPCIWSLYQTTIVSSDWACTRRQCMNCPQYISSKRRVRWVNSERSRAVCTRLLVYMCLCLCLADMNLSTLSVTWLPSSHVAYELTQHTHTPGHSACYPECPGLAWRPNRNRQHQNITAGFPCQH